MNITADRCLKPIEFLDDALDQRILGQTRKEISQCRRCSLRRIDQEAESLGENIARKNEIGNGAQSIPDGRRHVENTDMEILQQQRHEFNGDTNRPAHQGGEDLQNTEDTLECSGELVHGIVVNDDGFCEAIERFNNVVETVGAQSEDLTERIANGLKGTKQRFEDVGQSIKQKQSSALLGHAADEIVHAVGGQQCAIVDPTECFGYHVGGNLAGRQSGLEIAVLRNQIAERFAILGGDGVHLTLERIQ